MLRVAVIGSEEEISQQLLPLLQEKTGQEKIRVIEAYPDGEKLERFIRASFPRLIFLSMQDAKKAEYIARWIRQFATGTQIVGLAQQNDAETLRAALRAGMLDCLSFPLQSSALDEVLAIGRQNLATQSITLQKRGKVVSFLPAKPGVGASVTAMHVSQALARRTEERVLLADFDLNVGLQGFLFKLAAVRSATEAGEHAHHMDEEIWEALVATRGNLDLLGSGYVNPGQRLEVNSVKDLVEFWRRNYFAICLDHSGNFERYSIQLLMESDEILLISTPEIAPLHLAKTRLTQLRELGLADKVQFLVNRATRQDSALRGACEESVGMTVAQFLPNDYAGIEEAIFQGTHVSASSPLGRAYEDLADRLLPGGQTAQPESAKAMRGDLQSLRKLFDAVREGAQRASRDLLKRKSPTGEAQQLPAQEEDSPRAAKSRR